MKKIFRLFIVFSVPVIVLFLGNCKKEQFGNGNLSFSRDTLTFDTVFTSLGSTTKYFKVFNKDKKAIRISDIRLMHLVGSQFRINVDGISGDHFTDIEIPAKDSIYVFVEVTVNPNDASTPFVIIDDVVFTNNGNTSTVHLQAFGQNAHFHYGEEIKTGIVNWSSDLPHVVIGHDSVPGVLVGKDATLNIRAGCKVFFAGNSAIFVQGNLFANANTWADSIVFQGARLERYYEDKPGQWFGIVFLRDSNNINVPQGLFNHCVVNESSYGIYAGAGLSTNISSYTGTAGRPFVQIQNTIVKNSQNNAVYGFNAKITAENSLFYVSGDNLIKFGLGGEYSFTHCTMYNSGSRFVSHEKEVLLLSNLVSNGISILATEPLESSFTNCVIYGSLQNEISFNNFDGLNFTNFQNRFHYSNVKTRIDTFNLFASDTNHIMFNEEPRFINPTQGDFTPSDSTGYFSSLIDFCPAGLSLDIYDRQRQNIGGVRVNDIGAVETQP